MPVILPQYKPEFTSLQRVKLGKISVILLISICLILGCTERAERFNSKPTSLLTVISLPSKLDLSAFHSMSCLQIKNK